MKQSDVTFELQLGRQFFIAIRAGKYVIDVDMFREKVRKELSQVEQSRGAPRAHHAEFLVDDPTLFSPSNRAFGSISPMTISLVRCLVK